MARQEGRLEPRAVNHDVWAARQRITEAGGNLHRHKASPSLYMPQRHPLLLGWSWRLMIPSKDLVKEPPTYKSRTE